MITVPRTPVRHPSSSFGKLLNEKGVSYILLGQDQHHVDINADGSGAGVVVNDVTSWGARGNPKVPSEIAYSPAEGGDANWGYEIREPAVKMIWTKLQLEEQSRLEELDLIVKALDGMSNLGLRQITESRGLPSYPAKEPIEIVTEYLSLVCQHLIEAELNRRYGPELLRRTPINLVVTCPNVGTRKPLLHFIYHAHKFNRSGPSRQRTRRFGR